jgi:hypothetical protein
VGVVDEGATGSVFSICASWASLEGELLAVRLEAYDVAAVSSATFRVLAAPVVSRGSALRAGS